MRKVILIAAFLLGVNAILGQVILIRELLVNFSGNELSMGIIFCLWMAGGAIGGLIIARLLVERTTRPVNLFIATIFIISIITPLTAFLCRSARAAFGIAVYEIIGPLHLLLICGLLLVPISMVLSFCFVCICKLLQDTCSSEISGTGHIYISEALGETAAGTIFSFLLVSYFDSFQIISALAIINFSFLVWFSVIFKKRLYLPVLFLAASLLLIIFNAGGWLDKKSQGLQWYPQEVASYVKSPYGNISITKSAGTFNVYENGSLLFSTQDEAFNEESAHLLMLQHPAPKRVLLLGGGIGGMLRQILKHNPEKITYLELDPLIIDAARGFISEEDSRSLGDTRIQIINEDGRFFIKRTKQKFDIIIVNLLDATTLQLNRFYTSEFYREARSCLKEGGILAARVSSKEAIISDETAQYNASVYKTLKSVFSSVNIIPGESLIFIASDNPDINKEGPSLLIKRFQERSIKTRFLTPYHIQDRYYPDTLAYFKKRLKEQYKSARLNSDFRPICFYYYLILWGLQFNPGLAGFFKSILNINLPCILAIIALFYAAGILLIRLKKEPTRHIVTSAIAASGALGIALEIITIFSFQITYGYVYSKVGFLIALFMLGLALGGYIANKALNYFRDYTRLLSYVVFAFSVYILASPFIIKAAADAPLENTQFIFYIMMFLNGVGVGSQFPLGVAIVHSASVIWGADLLGAMAGSLIVSLGIIPALGIFRALVLASIFCGVIFLLLCSLRRKPRH